MSVLMPSRSRSSFIHYATLVRSPARVQGGAVNVPLPALNVTMPVGVVGVAEVSVTVAVHVVLWPDAIVDGVQLRVVLVLLGGWKCAVLGMGVGERGPRYVNVMV